MEGTSQVADAAVKFFSHLFKAEHIEEDNYVLNVKERMVTNEDNDNLTSLPTLQEVKDTVFSIDPDGLNRKFYQSAWQIIENDIHAAIISLFQGATLPKKFSHTCTVCFLKSIPPKILLTLGLLVYVILRVRSLLNISTLDYLKYFSYGGNVVIKLDMSKAYDRVSWPFLCFILRKFGFAES